MIIAFTMGFDERFAVRAMLRHGVGKDDDVTVLTPMHRSDERGVKAIEALEEFVKRYINGEGVSRYEVDVDDFNKAVPYLANLFRSWMKRPIIINLSGGMRLLIVETLVASIMSNLPITVELETEDGA
ncbi:MAG: CRISPR-associated CARF protein Csa3, partial [Nitrososphaerota archaeon]